MIFTFGFGHDCSCGLSLRGCYVELPGDYGEARAAMVAKYGRKWGFQYDTLEQADPEGRWHLQRVEANEACGCGGLGRAPWEPHR